MKKIITTTLLLAGMVWLAAPAVAQMPGQTEAGPALNLFDEGRHLKVAKPYAHQKVRLFRCEAWSAADMNPIWCKTFSSLEGACP